MTTTTTAAQKPARSTKQKVSADALKAFLGKAPAAGRTISEMGEQFGAAYGTVRKHLTPLVESGAVVKAGTRPNGAGNGRPADIYKLAN